MRPSRCLADFVAPKGVKADYAGMFAVTAGIGVDKRKSTSLDDSIRLLRHHAQVDRGPPGGGFRGSACTTVCVPTSGVMPPANR